MLLPLEFYIGGAMGAVAAMLQFTHSKLNIFGHYWIERIAPTFPELSENERNLQLSLADYTTKALDMIKFHYFRVLTLSGAFLLINTLFGSIESNKGKPILFVYFAILIYFMYTIAQLRQNVIHPSNISKLQKIKEILKNNGNG